MLGDFKTPEDLAELVKDQMAVELATKAVAKAMIGADRDRQKALEAALHASVKPLLPFKPSDIMAATMGFVVSMLMNSTTEEDDPAARRIIALAWVALVRDYVSDEMGKPKPGTTVN